MSLDILNEAFKKLDLLNEDTFDTSMSGINNLSNFMDADIEDEVVKVIDPDVEDSTELADSYVGKVIINCNVCHSHIFKDKDDVMITDDGVVNADETCPYCGESAGFVVVGEIQPFESDGTDSDSSEETEIDTDDLTESRNSKQVRIPEPYNKYFRIDSYEPSSENGEYEIGETVGGFELVAYLAPKRGYEDKFDGWPMLFRTPSGKLVVGEVSHNHVHEIDTDDLTESRNSKEFNCGSVDNCIRAVSRCLSSHGYDVTSDEAKLYIEGAADLITADTDYSVEDWYNDTVTNYPEELVPFKKLDNNSMTEGTAVLDKPVTKDLTQIQGTIADVLLRHSDDINACGADANCVKAKITEILSSGECKDQSAADEAIRIINSCRGPKLWSTIGTYMTGDRVAKVGKFKKRSLTASLGESVENIEVTTDSDTIKVTPVDNGGVSVTTEPKESPEADESEVIAPVSDETIAEIDAANAPEEDTSTEEEATGEPEDDSEVFEESLLTEGKFLDTLKKVATRVGADAATIVRAFTEIGPDKLSDFTEYVENKAVLKALRNGNEKVLNTLTKEDIEELEQDIKEYEKKKSVEEELDIEDVDEKSLDDLGESYLKNVYSNVKSFKTTDVGTNATSFIVEGIITFNSGVKKKTGFIFESAEQDRSGKIRFSGKNESFSKGRKSFTLVGTINDKKLVAESLTYNYRAKTPNGSSRVYGTVNCSR